MTKKGKMRKGLSLLLALMMLIGNVSLFAGLLKPEANAATAGRYRVRAYIYCTDDNMDNCCMTVTLYGRRNNGTGSEVSMNSFTWNNEDLAKTTEYTLFDGLSDAGVFPTRINLYLGGEKYYIDRNVTLEIHMNIEGTDYYLNATTHSYEAEELKATSGNPAEFYWKTANMWIGGKNNAFNCDYTVLSSDYPHQERITTPEGINSLTIPKTGESNFVYDHYSATVIDQYGVNWYADPTFYINKDLPYSVATAKLNTAVGCSITDAGRLSVTPSAQITGNDNMNTVYVSAVSGNAWSTLPVMINDPTYTVTYKKYDGSGSTVSEQVQYGDNGTRGEPLDERTGYTFMGWNENANQTSGESPKSNVTSNTTVFEAWSPNTYSVGFEKNGGSGAMSAQSFSYDEAKALSANQYSRDAVLTLNYNYSGSVNGRLTSPYTFDGWTGEDLVYDTTTYTATGGSPYTEIKQYNMPAPYGGFKAGDRYVFEFDAKGSGTLTSFFYGVANYKKISKAECSNGQVSSATDGNMSLSLTPNFQHYTVTYTIGENGDSTALKYLLLRAQTGSTVTVTGIRAYRIYADQETFLMKKDWNYQLYARWLNPDPITLPSATRQFFTFGGWYEEASCKNEYGAPNDEKYVTGKKTIYAKWNPVSFNLTYIEGLNGETVTETTYKYNTGNQAQKLKRPNPATEVPTGYTFTGWKVIETEGNWIADFVYPGGMTTKNAHGNVVLQAQYELNEYEAAVSVGEGGSITAGLPEGATLGDDGKYHFKTDCNETYNLTITLASGFDSVAPNVYREGCTYNLTGSGNTYNLEITDITGNVVIHVTPRPLQYSVTPDIGEGVTFNAENSSLDVNYNGTATIEVELQEGYKDLTATIGANDLAPVSVNGNTYTYEVEHVTHPMTVVFRATHIEFTVDFNAGEGMTLDPDSQQTVFYGEDLPFTVTPAEGYTDKAPEVTVNGAPLAPESSSEGVYSYVIANITEDKQVEITCTPNQYTVSVNTDAGLEAIADATVSHGNDYTLTLSLKEGYDAAKPTATVGETPITLTKGADGKYTGTVANVTDNITIEAHSTLNTYSVTISGDEGAELSETSFPTVGHGATISFTVTLKEHYTNTAPVVMNGDTTILPVNKEGDTYTYEVTVTAETTITVATEYNSYVIRFVLPESGKLIWNTTINEGDTPAYAGEDIDTVWDDNKHYVFTNEWTPDFVPATEDAVYVAVVEGSDHEWNEGTITVEPKCLTEGKKLQTCSVCGAERTVDVDPIGTHSWNEGVVTREPTCTEDGEKLFTCSRCDMTRNEPVNKLGHQFSVWQNTGDGHIHYCTRENCNYSETAEHRWDEGTVNEGFSCLTGGERTFVCLDCGATKVEAIDPNTGHQWGEWTEIKDGTSDHTNLERRTCTLCGAIQERTIDVDGGDPSGSLIPIRFNLFEFLKNFIMRIIDFFRQLRF